MEDKPTTFDILIIFLKRIGIMPIYVKRNFHSYRKNDKPLSKSSLDAINDIGTWAKTKEGVAFWGPVHYLWVKSLTAVLIANCEDMKSIAETISKTTSKEELKLLEMFYL